MNFLFPRSLSLIDGRGVFRFKVTYAQVACHVRSNKPGGRLLRKFFENRDFLEELENDCD